MEHDALWLAIVVATEGVARSVKNFPSLGKGRSDGIADRYTQHAYLQMLRAIFKHLATYSSRRVADNLTQEIRGAIQIASESLSRCFPNTQTSTVGDEQQTEAHPSDGTVPNVHSWLTDFHDQLRKVDEERETTNVEAWIRCHINDLCYHQEALPKYVHSTYPSDLAK